jgi:hypothetical protein
MQIGGFIFEVDGTGQIPNFLKDVFAILFINNGK